MGVRVVQFMSATQQPRNRISNSGVFGDPYHIPNELNIKDSLKIRNFFGAQGLHYSPTQIWQWIAHCDGLDITALFQGDDVLGASIGFFWDEKLTYLTHLTAVRRDLQGGTGIGQFLRERQIEWLYNRLGRQPMQEPPLHAVSLSANPDAANPKGAVGFQTYIFTKVLEWTITSNALPLVHALHRAHPELRLDRVLEQDVTALHFVDD